MDNLKVKTSFEVSVIVHDRVFRPVVHRYLDLLICSLRETLRNIDFGGICNSSPQVYIQNHPLMLGTNINVTGHHEVQLNSEKTVIGLGELSKAWRDTGAQRVLQQDPVLPPPYSSHHAESYFPPSTSSKLIYYGKVLMQ